ncbi:serine hydrolase domain-containing protein [Paenibacillus aurantius]|uniref:Serine hydrolase domain-containing protein n=1 Tax=Paenibacillus aurantius TaxID=2918900 RepID=A0AA96RG76_9BACL|nr:serine hydrolase domain-containing protein [Paenibacillus aurantius]WNQ12236.1 serine hydrolase domain-containing protein [Paenibacillus aurantius]
MKMTIRILAIIWCGLFVFPLSGSAESEGSMQVERSGTSVFSEVDAYIAREMKRQRLPGLALAIVQGDQILYLQGYGEADSSGRSVTPETPFGLGSIGKSITAIAVLQLADKGKIDLDAPIQRYLPTKYNGAEFITVRQLLNQTSGFSQISTFGNTLSSVKDQEPQNALEKNALSYAEKFLSQPKQTEHPYQYSNANYVLLGYMVQRVSGQSYGDYVKEHIFNPLSMPNSFVTLEEAADHGLATPYRRVFGYNVAYDGPYVYIPGDAPAGYLYTSAKDMSHYLIAQLNGGRFEKDSVLSSESIRLMQTEPVPGTYAMGWSADSINGLRVIGSPGGSLGFQAQAFMVPEQQLGVIVFANVLGAIDAAWPQTHVITTTHIASGVINILNGQPIGESGLSISQKYWLVNGLIFLLSAWFIYATARTVKRFFGPGGPAHSGPTKLSIKDMARIALHFAGLVIILLLDMTEVLPVWPIAAIFQPDVIPWLKIMTVLLALKGSMEIIRLVRSARHDKTAKLKC